MDAHTLTRIGRALYGDRWQAPIARALGVSTRAVIYWLRDGVPEGRVQAIRDLLKARAKEIAELRWG